MSIFPFLEMQSEKEAELIDLPIFCEYAFDFKKNDFIYKNGMCFFVYRNDALKIWIYKVLKTARFRYVAYTEDYGIEVDSLIGYSGSDEIIKLEIKRYIVEALMVNPYITELSNFRFTNSGDKLEVNFEVSTIYGSLGTIIYGGMTYD